MPKIITMIQQAKNDRERQKILNSLSPGSITGFLQKHKDTFASLGKMLHEQGFNPKRTKVFADALRKSGIPVRGFRKTAKHTYWVIFSEDKDRVMAMIKENETSGNSESLGLKRVRVELVCGNWPEGKPLPSTFDLVASRKYRGLRGLLAGAGVPRRSPTGSSDLLSGCKVPVFSYNNGFYYPVERGEDLRRFVENNPTQNS